MSDLVTKARQAKRENRQIEFKSSFDPKSDGQWCEIIKDITAISNSGGGVIIFGVNDDGSLSEDSCDEVSRIDPADIASRFAKYTNCSDPPIEVVDLEREGHKRSAFLIQALPSPLVFGKPGTYDAGGGKQKTAFGQGTIYFRHGAKSEPGVSDDVRLAFDRHLSAARDRWLKNVNRVVKAPAGAEVIVNAGSLDRIQSGSNVFRAVGDPKAMPVRLTRDKDKTTSGTFLHEEVSDGIFDEINNVVDANRALAKGRSRFFLGAEVYYRVYAERRYVEQTAKQFDLLFHAGACEFYAPSLYWALQLQPKSIARVLAEIYLAPKGAQIHWFMRTAILLGAEFCEWLQQMWDTKWSRYSQPPTFYFSFKSMLKDANKMDRKLVSARWTATTRFSVPGRGDVTASEVANDPRQAESLLSSTCMAVFEGNSDFRVTSRALDFIAHGEEFASRSRLIAGSIMSAVGDRDPGDLGESG